MGRRWNREHYRRISGDATGVEEPETGKSLPANYPSATRFDELSSAASDSDTLAAGDGSLDANERMDSMASNTSGKAGPIRRVKVSSVRLGDYVAEALVNGRAVGFHGVVETIIHLGPDLLEITLKGGERRAFVISGPMGWSDDMIYRER